MKHRAHGEAQRLHSEKWRSASHDGNARPYRVLITQKYASLGGSQTSLLHHLELIDRKRFAPRVVLSNEGWLTSKLDEMNIPWSLLKFGHWTNILSVPKNISLIFGLRRLIRQYDIDLIHANEHWVGPVSYFAARLAGIPVICHFRTGLVDLTQIRIRKYLYGWYDRVIVVADVLRQTLIKYVADPSRIIVIRDGVVPIVGVPRYWSKRRRRIVMNVGAIYEAKGQAKILEHALPWLKASRRHYLIFVGGTRESPSYVEAMKRVVAELNLKRQVIFLGSRQDVPRLLTFADALVAYSTIEGIPMVVMEAMLAGRPVIVSNTPGMNEAVIDGEVGRIIDFADPENQLKQALDDLTAHPSRWEAMGRHALDHASSHYSTRAMSDAIQAMYSELLESTAHARSAP